MSQKNRMGAQTLKRNKNVLAAFEMRLQGKSLYEIADELGVTPPTVSNYIKEELENRMTPLADEERKQQLDQLDIIYARLYKIFVSDPPLYQYGKLVVGHDGMPAVDLELLVKTAKEMRNVLDSKARLTAAYKPVQTQTEVTYTTPVDMAIAGLVEQIEAKNRRIQSELAS